MSPVYTPGTAVNPVQFPGPLPLTLWNAEQPATGTKSTQFAILPVTPPFGGDSQISITIFFAGAPGAFQIDLQTADEDADVNYVNEPGATLTTVNANNAARMELKVKARFARLIMTTQSANAVNLTAKAFRF